MTRPLKTDSAFEAPRRDRGDNGHLGQRFPPFLLTSRWLFYVGPGSTGRSFRAAGLGEPSRHVAGAHLRAGSRDPRLPCENVAKLIRKGDLSSTGKRGTSLNREQVEAWPIVALPSEEPGPPAHLASTSALTLAPTRTTSGYRPGRLPSFSVSPGQRSRGASTAARCPPPRMAGGIGCGGI